MNINLTIFPARNGDSLLLEIEEKIFLIDGGYVNTYNDHIKPKLTQLSYEKKEISHVIVTHIDGDHISGIIKLIEENKKNTIVTINNVWHNSFRHLKNINIDWEVLGKPLSNMPVHYLIKEERENPEKNISAVQGSTLASLLRKYNYNWNSEFNNKAISIDEGLEIDIDENIKLKLLSPDNKKLENLKKYWKKELYKMGYGSDEDLTDFNEDIFEYILSLAKEKKRLTKKNSASSSEIHIEELLKLPYLEDSTVTNGSSISFIIEYKELKFLFLADSHPSLIVESLHKHYKKEEFPVKFNLIKISHHGSSANTNKELLKLIDSENYVFSTNGNIYNHPDEEVIAKIISRNADFTRSIYFNYQLEKVQLFKNKDLMKKYKYEIIENIDNQPSIISFPINE